MRLGREALLEIVALVQDGIFNGRDISENLRQLDLEPSRGWDDNSVDDTLVLTAGYLEDHPRAPQWTEE